MEVIFADFRNRCRNPVAQNRGVPKHPLSRAPRPLETVASWLGASLLRDPCHFSQGTKGTVDWSEIPRIPSGDQSILTGAFGAEPQKKNEPNHSHGTWHGSLERNIAFQPEGIEREQQLPDSGTQPARIQAITSGRSMMMRHIRQFLPLPGAPITWEPMSMTEHGKQGCSN